MNREELLNLVNAVRERPSELSNLEVKAAEGGTPKRLFAAMSAFANSPGGGVILLGLDDDTFEVCGVGDAQQLQEEISDVANDEMEPPLRPEFTLDELDGKTVVAVEIAEVPPAQRPCFYKKAGLNGGSYIRVGNTNRQMTEYEVFGYISSRGQPKDDEDLVPDAGLDDLDLGALDHY